MSARVATVCANVSRVAGLLAAAVRDLDLGRHLDRGPGRGPDMER